MKTMKTFGLRRFLSVTAAALMLTGCLTGYILANPLVASAAAIKKGSTAYVTAEQLNIRSGPGTNYARRGYLTQGFKLEVLEVDGDWARISDGWVSTKYLSLSKNNVSKGDKVRVTASTLYVRQGPGTNYARVGQLKNGAQVEILKVEKGWGQISTGWISLDFVAPVGGSSSGSQEVLPGTGSGYREGDTVYITADRLNIRSGPGTNYNKRGSVTNGYKVTLLEVQGSWGRIAEGWISLNYVRKGGTSGVHAGDSVKVTADRLNIRQGAGTGYARVGHLNRGDTVTIQEVSGSWGKTRAGWISLNYVSRVGGSSSMGLGEGDRVEVTSNTLNIRSGAGTNYYRRGSLTRGYQVELIEVNGNWGRIGEGWICLDYVKTV